LQAVAAQEADPAVQGDDTEGARGVAARKTEALLRDAAQLFDELSVRKGLYGEGTDEAVAKQGHRLCVIARLQGHDSPLRTRRVRPVSELCPGSARLCPIQRGGLSWAHRPGLILVHELSTTCARGE
jgi:hypothetical protein